MPPEAPWRAPTRPRRKGASSAPPRSLQDWKALLGRKVSLRYRLDDPTHPWSEAVGVVMEAEDSHGSGRIAVLDKRGQLRRVPIDDIVAAKVFPL